MQQPRPRPPPARQSPRYRRVLWAALIINAAMFGIELAGGLRSGSVSLLADAVDFFGDAASGVKRWLYERVIRRKMNRNVARVRASKRRRPKPRPPCKRRGQPCRR